MSELLIFALIIFILSTPNATLKKTQCLNYGLNYHEDTYSHVCRTAEVVLYVCMSGSSLVCRTGSLYVGLVSCM